MSHGLICKVCRRYVHSEEDYCLCEKDALALESERDQLREEVKKLKAELDVRSNDPLIDNHMDYLQQQCDLLKSKALALAELVEVECACNCIASPSGHSIFDVKCRRCKTLAVFRGEK